MSTQRMLLHLAVDFPNEITAGTRLLLVVAPPGDELEYSTNLSPSGVTAVCEGLIEDARSELA